MSHVVKYSIPMLFLGLFFIQAFYTQASGDTPGLVACAGGDACNFCSFVNTTNTIIDWVIVVATTLTVLLLAFAGFRMITSAGDASALEHAKKLLVNSFIGILIMLGGWTLVDTALKLFAGGDLGVWNAVECGGAVPVAPASDVNIKLEVEKGIVIRTQEKVDSLEGPESIVSTGGDITPYVSSGGNGETVTFTFKSSLAIAQQGHLSSTLSSFQGCVANKVVGGSYIITSVSDDKIANGTYTWEYCAKNGSAGGCAHSKGSCHYGGTKCVGNSYALDIRTSNLTTTQKQSLISAATSCGGWAKDEGNHIHISKGDACSCR